MRDLCYIAAPFAPGRGRGVQENVRRANKLAAHAVTEGYAPVVVHSAIQDGVYGDDANPVHRDRGLEICRALVTAVGDTDGEFWILADSDGEATVISAGVRAELEAYAETASIALPQTVRVWAINEAGPQSVLDVIISGADDLKAVGLLP